MEYELNESDVSCCKIQNKPITSKLLERIKRLSLNQTVNPRKSRINFFYQVRG